MNEKIVEDDVKFIKKDQLVQYIQFLIKFIREHDIHTVVDIGCGDFRCGKLIYDDLNISYTGYDTCK